MRLSGLTSEPECVLNRNNPALWWALEFDGGGTRCQWYSVHSWGWRLYILSHEEAVLNRASCRWKGKLMREFWSPPRITITCEGPDCLNCDSKSRFKVQIRQSEICWSGWLIRKRELHAGARATFKPSQSRAFPTRFSTSSDGQHYWVSVLGGICIPVANYLSTPVTSQKAQLTESLADWGRDIIKQAISSIRQIHGNVRVLNLWELARRIHKEN